MHAHISMYAPTNVLAYIPIVQTYRNRNSCIIPHVYVHTHTHTNTNILTYNVTHTCTETNNYNHRPIA